jgi:iron complex outermembrane receptor protein
VQPHDRLTLDVAAFYNVYDRLRILEMGSLTLQTGPEGPYFLLPRQLANNLDGETYGAEIAASWQATRRWRWHVNYSYLHIALHAKPGSSDTVSEKAEGNDPHHQISVRSSLNLPAHLELDAGLRYVDSLPNFNLGSYLAADARLGWRPSKRVEFSIVFQNLFDPQHGEFGSSFLPIQSTEVERSVYGQFTLRF